MTAKELTVLAKVALADVERERDEARKEALELREGRRLSQNLVDALAAKLKLAMAIINGEQPRYVVGLAGEKWVIFDVLEDEPDSPEPSSLGFVLAMCDVMQPKVFR